MFENNNISNCLIIVPSTNLRDNEWINEFKKWGYESWLPKVTIECVQTAYKWKDQKFDFIILDEVHAYLSQEFRAVFDFERKYLLGLTATPPKEPDKYSSEKDREYWDVYNSNCPTVYRKTIQEGVKLGIASPYVIYNLEVPLTASEKRSYSLWDTKFREAAQTLAN
jgi:superfamily II DNA or RNA helicase